MSTNLPPPSYNAYGPPPEPKKSSWIVWIIVIVIMIVIIFVIGYIIYRNWPSSGGGGGGGRTRHYADPATNPGNEAVPATIYNGMLYVYGGGTGGTWERALSRAVTTDKGYYVNVFFLQSYSGTTFYVAPEITQWNISDKLDFHLGVFNVRTNHTLTIRSSTVPEYHTDYLPYTMFCPCNLQSRGDVSRSEFRTPFEAVTPTTIKPFPGWYWGFQCTNNCISDGVPRLKYSTKLSQNQISQLQTYYWVNDGDVLIPWTRVDNIFGYTTTVYGNIRDRWPTTSEGIGTNSPLKFFNWFGVERGVGIPTSGWPRTRW